MVDVSSNSLSPGMYKISTRPIAANGKKMRSKFSTDLRNAMSEIKNTRQQQIKDQVLEKLRLSACGNKTSLYSKMALQIVAMIPRINACFFWDVT